MDKQEFAEAFEWLCSAFPNRDVPKQTWAVYYEMLKDLPYPVFRGACATCLARSQFFPSIHDIREAAADFNVRLSKLPDPYKAWGMVLGAISQMHYEDIDLPPLIEECVQDIGGWNHLKETQMIGADRARFLEVYEARVSRYRDETLIAPPKLIHDAAQLMSGDSRKELTDGE